MSCHAMPCHVMPCHAALQHVAFNCYYPPSVTCLLSAAPTHPLIHVQWCHQLLWRYHSVPHQHKGRYYFESPDRMHLPSLLSSLTHSLTHIVVPPHSPPSPPVAAAMTPGASPALEPMLLAVHSCGSTRLALPGSWAWGGAPGDAVVRGERERGRDRGGGRVREGRSEEEGNHNRRRFVFVSVCTTDCVLLSTLYPCE